MNWALLISKSKSNDDITNIKSTIHQYITETILPLYGKAETPSAHTFFNAINENLPENQAAEQRNVYHDDNIDIEVSTVHAVKEKLMLQHSIWKHFTIDIMNQIA